VSVGFWAEDPSAEALVDFGVGAAGADAARGGVEGGEEEEERGEGAHWLE
jgi:hypothetical protein